MLKLCLLALVVVTEGITRVMRREHQPVSWVLVPKYFKLCHVSDEQRCFGLCVLGCVDSFFSSGCIPGPSHTCTACSRCRRAEDSDDKEEYQLYLRSVSQHNRGRVWFCQTTCTKAFQELLSAFPKRLASRSGCFLLFFLLALSGQSCSLHLMFLPVFECSNALP